MTPACNVQGCQQPVVRPERITIRSAVAGVTITESVALCPDHLRQIGDTYLVAQIHGAG